MSYFLYSFVTFYEDDLLIFSKLPMFFDAETAISMLAGTLFSRDGKRCYQAVSERAFREGRKYLLASYIYGKLVFFLVQTLLVAREVLCDEDKFEYWEINNNFQYKK
jgi:hypothetical protein